MNELVDVAIVGAGPYGLSLAAHLGRAGISYRQFGLPMQLWRTAMPRGMHLKSQGFASNLSDPDGAYTLRDFCRESGRAYADYGLPVSLETFLDYGEWFRRHCAPQVEEVLVRDLTADDRSFVLTLDHGERVRARRVVIAVGVEHFARTPQTLAELPETHCTHSSEHDDLDVFTDREVVVIGAGQSALESAALLHEAGATVNLITRRSKVIWNGPPLSSQRPLYRRMREPESGLGSGLSTWFYSEHPSAFARLPRGVRVDRAKTALGPAGAWWLRRRVEGQFPIHLGHTVERARTDSDRVLLTLRARSGEQMEMAADHVIAATGYPPNLGRLNFLDGELRRRLDTVDRTPRVGRDFESSVPGLFFVGAAVAPSFGPVMRFVYGADYAVRRVARRLASDRLALREPVR